MKRDRLKILIVDDFEAIRDLVSFYITENFSVSVDQAEKLQEAISLIRENNEYHLIVSDCYFAKGTVFDLISTIQHQGYSVPVGIMCSEDLSQHPQFLKMEGCFQIAKPFSREQFLNEITPYLDWAKRQQKEYIPVSIDLLLKIKTIHVALYISLNPQKYVQLTQNHSDFNDSDFKKYKEKGVSHLYIKASEARNFISDFEKSILSQSAWESLNPDQATHLVSLHTEVLKDLCESLGWDERLVHLAEENIKKALLLSQSHPKLSSVIQHFQKIDRLGYADHCVLNVLISTQLAENLMPNDGQVLVDLTVASLFHDYTLSDDQFHDEKKLLRQIKQKEFLHLKDVKDFLSHPILASELCRQWEFCSAGAVRVIQNHHETPDGLGFPKGLGADELDLASSIFIVAEDLTMYLIEHFGKIEINQYLQSRKTKYSAGHTGEALEKLKALSNR